LIYDIGDALHTLEPAIKVETRQQTGHKLKDLIYDNKTDEHFEMKAFTKSMLEDILKKDYKDIDIESIEEIDRVFNKIMQEKDS
jgi:hypothetical protein